MKEFIIRSYSRSSNHFYKIQIPEVSWSNLITNTIDHYYTETINLKTNTVSHKTTNMGVLWKVEYKAILLQLENKLRVFL